MKKVILFTGLVAALMSCNKIQDIVPSVKDDAGIGNSLIMFSARGEGLDANVSTKTTAVTSLNSFNVLCENTTSSSLQWEGTAILSGTNYVTGMYWPSVDPKYAFYASNMSGMQYSAGDVTLAVPDGSLDVICAYSPYQAGNYKASTVLLTFDHIFTRIGKVTISKPSDYDNLTVHSISLGAPVSGTYNLNTGTWTPGSSTSHSLENGANDVYVLPGTYTMTVNYTITKGDYSEAFTKSASVSLVKGKINEISAVAPGSAEEIFFNVAINPWTVNPIDVNLQ